MNPRVTIAICTRDRALHLRETLAAIARVLVPQDLRAELLVVDNGSRDSTAEVVRAAVLPNLPVRYVREAQHGLSHARNTAIAVADGEVLLCTDDDVRPPANWIEEMCRPIVVGQAHAVAGGVRVAPHLRRRWLLEGFPAFVASTDTLTSSAPALLTGANMAFARRVLSRVPVFDTELGAGALGFGEDTLFSYQIAAAGFQILNLCDVAVEHHFDASRLSPTSVLEVARRMGQSKAYIYHHWLHSSLFSLPWLHAARSTLALIARRVFRHSEWHCVGVPPYWALHLVFAKSLLRQYLRESRRRRNYAYQGLTKCEGSPVADPSSLLNESATDAHNPHARSNDARRPTAPQCSASKVLPGA